MTKRMPILLVEPDERLARLTARFLANHELDVTTVASARLVFEELLLRRYACVVIDVTSELERTCKLCEGLGVAVVPLVGRSDTSSTLASSRFTPHELLALIQRTLSVARSGV